MPPRIRTRAKALKENIGMTENKLKPITKVPRKALADKTNSASDDTSVEIPKKVKKTITKSTKQNAVIKQKVVPNQGSEQNSQNKENAQPVAEVRPRRDRRLPTRFVENRVLNTSNSKDKLNVLQKNSSTNISNETPPTNETPPKNATPPKTDKMESSLFKTPEADSSLIANRPRRICRLPSRFEDHSVSPNKYIPIQPANASTPIPQSKNKLSSLSKEKQNIKSSEIIKDGKDLEKQLTVKLTRSTKIVSQKASNDNSSDKSSPDSNNNAKSRSTRVKKTINTKSTVQKSAPMKKLQSPVKKIQSPMKTIYSPAKNVLSSSKKVPSLLKRPLLTKTHSPVEIIQKSVIRSPIQEIISKPTIKRKKIIDKNLSFKVLGGTTKSQKSADDDMDIYEFTFDPNEEPQPKKKKIKKAVTKKPKPKRVVYKSNYDQNISKALAALKKAIKPVKNSENQMLPQITEHNSEVAVIVNQDKHVNYNKVQDTNATDVNNLALNDTGKNSVHECNYPSIRVEDIAADIEPSMDHHDDINYSPVNSPRSNDLRSPNPRETPEKSVHNNDPLNLLEEFSFDDQPVASSSMNMSARHPLASPWRVEFSNLPVKWPVNAYVKPNMTPAVESSFISSENTNAKKHVYTNMVPQGNDTYPEIVDNTPNLKQPSIISFIKEMAEKSAKKKRGRSVSPTKAMCGELNNLNVDKQKTKKVTKKAANKEPIPNENTSDQAICTTNDTSNENENLKEERVNRKRKNEGNIISDIPAKSPRKQKDKDCTYFGFDDSENVDLENVSPIKVNNNPQGRSLRPRSRAVLKEINGPTRAALPVAVKSKIATSSDAVNRVYEELKSAADAPQFPEKNVDDVVTNIEDASLNDDSQSVHLFEDIEVVHHLKPTRKSYGKAKKVTFRQRSTSDSESHESIAVVQNDSSDYDDLGDLTFEIPNVKEKKTIKKKKPKKLMTKKEEQEAEAWAVNFNSMCEDIEEFPLLVE